MSTDLFEIPHNLLTLRADNIFTCTARDYFEIQESYKRFPLPNDILFPWLHGVDGRSNQQNLFFRVRRSLVPNYRGVLVVHCNPLIHSQRLTESVTPLEILDNEAHFLNKTTTDVTINLRNFENQVLRFATLCDVFLYGERAEELAPLMVKAQEEFYQQRMEQIEQVASAAGKRAVHHANYIKYKTIIIQGENEFSVFEEQFPQLVMYDSSGRAMKKTDFYEMEGAQMREMSAASEVTRHVWAGNTQDAPISSNDITYENTASTFDSNPHRFSICIECHDLGDIPTPSILTLARETLNELKQDHLPSEIIHLDMHGTGVPFEKKEFDSFYDCLYHLLLFMDDQVNRGRRILIHCSDGYTESSVLTLTWIMYHLKLRLPDAYLYLQEKRSFFVYAADLAVLKKIERLLFQEEEDHEPEPKRRKSEVGVDSLNSLRIGNTTENNKVLHDDTYLNSISNQIASGHIYKQIQLSPTAKELAQHPWFYSPRFEGSFPSRILPFLYLGNLNHATNPDMLKALNITHVVSVGENADLQTKGFELLFLDNLYDDGIDAIRERLDHVMKFVEIHNLNMTYRESSSITSS
ncbi:hypothetical protein RO3G_07214 [Rhizopus delemar RA 99-880]|uniref:Tyrosine specific protein phosphatases domain-containing protein n=1 Tax=Rhizopus delemar (strain RA 99-880 / ATCC MYA-4621 / FGSC 9543 / NRRL 43880) TaxID=246409 RepID=I1C229_RHIO9|nr:hypothetical protein RO3G_07214 [Rhizopus delemar RA 99-880]|eukprot:EIE82509.1 hypothetical protein RO3G_07214 [Rhizopus delemar RA 99-880]